MDGRVVDLLSTPHLAAEALMPWLLNGTLDQAERRQIEAHLAACAQCRTELEQQRRLLALYRAAAAPPASAPQVEAALAALTARLPAAGPTAGAAGRALFRPLRWWPFTVALQLGVIVALGIALWLQAMAPSTAPEYRGLAAAAAPDAAALVLFDPGASESAMRGALHRAQARLVDGPTAAGAYLVRFDGARDAGLAALRAEGVVLRVEPLAVQR